jgi:CDP-glucose 4,6-dehydratase
VLHLAAQALVRRSYDEPLLTFATNVMGTANVLDAATRCPDVRAVVTVTSDKCYRNQEWTWGYRETDTLGGGDPYSASKGAAELVVASYQDRHVQTHCGRTSPLPIASVRAGNVLGGGDWSADRLIPDIVRAIAADADVTVRYPAATRPWQHVLEPLSGYLQVAHSLATAGLSHAEAWNFGPSEQRPLPVGVLVARVLDRWAPRGTRLVLGPEDAGKESTLLHLDCSKALHRLGWRLVWTSDEMVSAIVEWYRAYQDDPAADMAALSLRQIGQYVTQAAEQQLAWATSAPHTHS